MAAIGPWNIQTIYPENPGGDWVVYFRHVLDRLEGQVDGVAIHTYGRDGNPAAIASEARMAPPYHHRRSMFRTYQDFWRRSLRDHAIFGLFDRDEQNIAWQDVNRGWIGAYAEINRWNSDPATKRSGRRFSTVGAPRRISGISRARTRSLLTCGLLQNDYRWYR